MRHGFGEIFGRLRRQNSQLSLREFAERFGFDAGTLSKIERGRMSPPKSTEKLEEYANALGISPGGDDWIDFFDQAAAARGEIPSDIMSDDEVAGQLPVLFRTLRGEQVPEEDLKKLLSIIKRA